MQQPKKSRGFSKRYFLNPQPLLLSKPCTLWHLMSYAQDFAKWKTLTRCVFVVAFVVVKLKIKKFFILIHFPWNGSFLGFLGPLLPKCCSILLKFWPKVVSNKTNTVFVKFFKILNFSLNGRHPKFTILTLENQKYCKKAEFPQKLRPIA